MSTQNVGTLHSTGQRGLLRVRPYSNDLYFTFKYFNMGCVLLNSNNWVHLIQRCQFSLSHVRTARDDNPAYQNTIIKPPPKNQKSLWSCSNCAKRNNLWWFLTSHAGKNWGQKSYVTIHAAKCFSTLLRPSRGINTHRVFMCFLYLLVPHCWAWMI